MNLFGLNTMILLARNSMNRSPVRRGLVPVVLACFALSPVVKAVNPPPDGGYPRQDTAEGDDALFTETTGENNTALGFHALYGNTTGASNTAVGVEALASNIDGTDNTATGLWALKGNTTGSKNTAIGFFSLLNNTTGSDNVAMGDSALNGNSTGSYNIAIGDYALFGSGSASNGNIAIGHDAGFFAQGDNNILIAHPGSPRESSTIHIGSEGSQVRTYIAGILRSPVTGLPVVINQTGRLGVATSSVHFKDEIKPMDKASEAVLALRPVTFRYKHEVDPDNIPQFGLVAEQVEKVDPDLVARDKQGKPYTVRYEAVNAMLLNEFLKEHRKVEELEATVGQLKSTVAERRDLRTTVALQQDEIESLTANLRAQAAQIQKVSDQLTAGRSVPPMLVRNP